VTGPQHLPFGLLLQLAGRLVVVEGLQACGSTTTKAANKTRRLAARLLEDEVELRDGLTAGDGETPPMQSHMGAIVRRAETLAASSPAPRKVVNEYLTVIRQRTQEIDCGLCARSPRTPCSPTMDRDVVDLNVRDGACIGRLRAQFDQTVEVARWFFGAFGEASSYVLNRDLRLSTSHTGSPRPHGFECSHVSVTASHVREPKVSRVKLIFHLEQFAESTYHVIPYVFLHELICHVWDGAETGIIPEPSDADPFAEGWMDFIAICLHDEWLDSRYPQLPAPPTPTVKRKALAWQFHECRAEAPANTKDRDPATLRAQGVSAARTMLEGLEAEGRRLQSPKAREWFYRLSAFLLLYRPTRRTSAMFWEPTAADITEVARKIEESGAPDAWNYICSRLDDLLASRILNEVSF
jgi:hypothetical protein